MIRKISIQTTTQVELLNITTEIEKIVSSEKIYSGTLLIFVPHTTAAITINEQADPDVALDIENVLNKLIPFHADYSHLEGNAAAHVKASLIGSSIHVIAEKGKLLLGTWQGIFFCEFDGPRHREVWVKMIP